MAKDYFAAANLTIGQINALVKKMGGEQRVLDFLAGRLRLTQFFDYKDGVVYLTIENPALITELEWVLQLGERFNDFHQKFVTQIDIAQSYHTFDRMEICIFKKVLTVEEMMTWGVSKPHPNLVFQLQKVIPTDGIRLMGYTELVIMHEPILRIHPKQRPAQLSLFFDGVVFVEDFRGKGQTYPQGRGFVYVKK